jgi:hypothetical protein
MKEEDVLLSGLLDAVRADGRESVELLLLAVERNVACDVISDRRRARCKGHSDDKGEVEEREDLHGGRDGGRLLDVPALSDIECFDGMCSESIVVRSIGVRIERKR